MAKRASPATVGAFVVLGMTLAVIAIVLFGSGRLFRKHHEFVCFFKGNLNGLKLGAPVKFAGVQIGSVTRIRLRLPPSEGKLRAGLTNQVLLPVICEIDETAILNVGGTGEYLNPRGLEQMIQAGLRAQLAMESVLTGLLYIDINMHPATPLDLVLAPGTSPYPEIPTIQTSLQAVQEQAMKAMAKLDQIDFAGLIRSMTDTSVSINNLANSPSLKAALDSLARAASSLEKVSVSINQMVTGVNVKVDPLIASLTTTSNDAALALRQTRETLAQVQATFEPGTPLNYELTKALEDVSSASTAVRQLAEYLERNPSALVRGKYVSDGKR
jgi:paraquat-inducible protein B